MRILNVSSLYPPNVIGGAELGVRTLAEAMAEAGHDVHVVTLQPPAEAAAPATAEPSPVTVHAVPLANVYWPFVPGGAKHSAAGKLAWHSIDTANHVMARRVEKIVRRVKPDVVLTHNLQGFSTAVLPAIKRAGVPLVHVPHDYALLCPQTTLCRNGSGCGFQKDRCSGCRILTAPRQRHVDAADAVISVSQSLLDTHRLHGLFENVPAKVIYNALRPQFEIADQVAARADNEPFTFGYMGRIERSKGIETLLAAAAELEASGANFRLRIAGRAAPDYLATLQQRWTLKSISYEGFVDAAEFLGEIDTLVFPSEWLEALGNGVFEAFSQGVPVIGADSGGIAESIDDGVTGFVFEPGNAKQLTNLMSKLLTAPELRMQMGNDALRKSHEYLAPNRAAEYIAFLEAFLRRSAAGVAA
ncbi:MAG: glycosyltransferase family 4 protein [Gammaproteobacteria bacterium]|nr:glycosyltransferase family 4 protein [Gammaproteobacteria bacterium]